MSYKNSKVKILLILKEVNSKDRKSVDLKSFLKEGAHGRRVTWANVARWVYCIQNQTLTYKWEDISSKKRSLELMESELPSVCVMNMKKVPGGHTSVHEEVEASFAKDLDLLKEQFNLYNNDSVSSPDIIIGCGSFNSDLFAKQILEVDGSKWKETSRGVGYYEFKPNKFFIDYLHPAARASDNILHYGLLDAVNEIRNKK